MYPDGRPAESLAPILLQRIAELLRNAGANQTEARCALEAAIAMLPEMGLELKPTAVWRG